MKLIYILPVVALLVILSLYYRLHPLTSKVRIRATVITTDVALTEAQKQKGLGGRENLAKDRGMLFPYTHKEQYNFWMRDMRFPLDFLWIDDATIVDLTENVPYPKGNEKPIITTPRTPVNKVLELSAGTIKRLGIQIGDTVEFLDR